MVHGTRRRKACRRAGLDSPRDREQPALTGDDLTVDDVWAVAVEGAPAALADAAREKMRAARELVERAAHGSQRAHVRRQHRLRPLRLAVDPRGADRGAPAAAAAQPRVRRRRAVPGRDRARGDAAARERAREGLLGRARRDGRAAARVPQPRRAAARARAAARSARAAISRRSRTSRCRSSARARRASTASGCRAARRSRASGLEPIGLAGEGGPLARQRHAVHGGVRRARRSCARGGSRGRPTSRARSRSRRCRARARASCPQIHALRPLRGPARLGGERPPAARGLGDHRGAPLVRQGAGRLLAALRAAGARRHRATCSTTSTATVAVELNAATDNPLVLVDDELLVSNGNFHGQPLALRARRARDGGRRAREHLRAARRAARQPEPLGRAAGVPHRRRRAQLRLHDPAVRGRVARQREQGALPSGERRLDPDERRPGGSRLDGQRGRAEGAGRCSRTPSARSRSSCSRARRRVEFLAPLEPGAGVARRARVRARRSRRGCATTARSPATSRRSRRRSATARSSPRSRREVGELA